MDAGELAGLAVGVVAAVATGAATGVGEGAGAAVTEVVRARLTSTERGQRALEGLDADANAAPARSEAAGVLREEVEADPELRNRLEHHLSGITAHSSVVITGGRVSRSPIAVGPLTINNTRQARGWFAAAAALLVALVVLAAYGGVQLFGADDSPGATPQGPARSGPRAAEDGEGPPDRDGDTAGDTSGFLSAGETAKILPTLQDMPPNWTQYRRAQVASASEAGECHKGRVEYKSTEPDVGHLVAEFDVYACPSADTAGTGYKELIRRQQGYDETTPISMPRFGDESTALVYYKSAKDNSTAVTVVRTGTVLLMLKYAHVDDQPDYSAHVQELTAIFAGLVTG
ncbi:hypothetical protein OIE73_23580 [Streptomyces hirsutus]|uniref:Serine/threonine protein kinase n=1 Tax=Streptomyces hirsutus TaxID=35620 RepID=A0ABZ1GQF9_9ACTN|nr:hypothetical protein [Streptomyces hirsutus]WSD08413.1 hypothetical protein OIE73_23580 [Streptomyces hirsutus]